MSINTLIHEFGRFMKDNIWRIVMGMILGIIVLLSARYMISEILLKEKSEAFDYLSQAYEQEPAEFQAVVTIEDGDVFANSNIYDDYFSSPKVVKQVEEMTGIKFSKWIESERALELVKDSNFRGGIAAIRDSSSGLITFRFLVAPTSEENLKIAQAYEKILESNQINFNKSHTVEITRPSEIIELLNLDEVTTVPTHSTLNMFNGLNIKNIIIYSVLGCLVGFIITFIILWIKRLNNEKIVYSFEYSWELNDDQVLIPETENSDEICNIINMPPLENRVVLVEEGNTLNKINNKSNYHVYSDIKEAVNNGLKPSEIDLIIDSNETNKNWYKQQYKLAKLYHVPIKIVHMI